MVLKRKQTNKINHNCAEVVEVQCSDFEKQPDRTHFIKPLVHERNCANKSSFIISENNVSKSLAVSPTLDLKPFWAI